MSDAQENQELDQNKRGSEPLDREKKGFFNKMKDTLSSDDAKIVYTTLSIAAAVAGIAIAIEAGLTTLAIALMAGGVITGGIAFYRLRLNRTSNIVPA